MAYYGVVRDFSRLEHHGIPGQKWGVRNGPPYPLERQGRYSLLAAGDKKGHKSFEDVQRSASAIGKEVDKYRKGGPAGNQNCQACTWAMECQFRGMKTLPRPVYSPRDPIFDMDGIDIVKGAKREAVSNVNDVVSKVRGAGDGARFYTHVKWTEGTGGHEFITANIKNKVYVIDAQQGLVDPINGKRGRTYFNSIDYSNSFMARMDDKELNRQTLKMNDHKNIVKWDWNKDIPYMAAHDMLSEEDMEYAQQYMRRSK